MNKTIKIEFNGLASGTTANVKLEYQLGSDDTEKVINNNDILREAQELYEEASKYAQVKTVEKALKK